MSDAHFEIYQERGMQLARARRLMAGDVEYRSALALVSVHSAISFNDALLAKFELMASHNEDHLNAVIQTERECRKRKLSTDGIKHLQTLLRAKTQVSYSDTPVTPKMSELLSISAARFEAWFYKTLGEI